MKNCGSNPGPFADLANTLPLSYPVIAPTILHLKPTPVTQTTLGLVTLFIRGTTSIIGREIIWQFNIIYISAVKPHVFISPWTTIDCVMFICLNIQHLTEEWTIWRWLFTGSRTYSVCKDTWFIWVLFSLVTVIQIRSMQTLELS